MGSLQVILALLTALAPTASGADTGAGWADVAPADGVAIEVGGRWMVPYEERISGTGVAFRMVPAPGGEVLVGSPESEPDRDEAEGPQRRVLVGPMWVGACEVTWAEYQTYMNLYTPLKALGDLRYRAKSDATLAGRIAERAALAAYLETPDGVDAVTCPTPLYDATFTYEPGEDSDQPAVTMTQFAAKQYTKWLSGVTGRDYRLPTEAEWEHAARAGSTTAYCFGNDAVQLGDHAWYYDNADDQTHRVGQKKPNAWGLYDTHGNAAEWCLDQFDADHYASLPEASTTEAWQAMRRATAIWPRAYRGGSWQDDPDALRSAARRGSVDDEWTLSDPNLPISPWWYTEYESQAVGFRVFRPVAAMDAAARAIAWEADVDDLRLDVEDRLMEGRGVQAPANQHLLPAVTELKGLD